MHQWNMKLIDSSYDIRCSPSSVFSLAPRPNPLHCWAGCLFVRGSMSEHQILSHRPSYISAILIQYRECMEVQACTACRGGPGLRPFPECRRLPDHFGGACGNCKWRNHASHCFVRDGEDAIEVIEIVDTDEEAP
ncbi:hypothetical protein VTO42DRAFT_1157 [Malbranchea cinnamomea]